MAFENLSALTHQDWARAQEQSKDKVKGGVHQQIEPLSRQDEDRSK